MKRRSGIGLTLTLALAVSAPAAAQEVDPEALRLLLARANTLISAGNDEAALAALDRLLARTDSIDSSSPATLRQVLRRALEARADVRWRTSQRDGLDDDLDRLIRLDPAYEIATVTDDEGLLARFNRRRERLVGYLRVGIAPADAQVVLNGTVLEDPAELIPVLAGDHVVGAQRRGYASQQEEVSVRANRTEGVGLTLERSSATFQLATEPPGAQVVLDGETVGFTVAQDDNTASAPLVIEGLLPGWHELEVTLVNHRPFRQRFEVPSLTDYDLGLLVLRLAVGSVTLRNVPPDAELWVDGAPADTTRGGDGSLRAQLSVGTHDLLVTASGGRAWTGSVPIVDGGTAAFDPRLRPGLAFLGIAGGDALDRDAANGDVLQALANLREWTVLDRRRFAADLLADEALALGSGTEDELRCRFEDQAPSALYVTGALDRTAPGELRLLVWAAGSPLPAAHLRLPRGDVEALNQALATIGSPLPASRAWHGVDVIDAADGPIVATIAAASPAATAGLRVGDRLLAIGGGGMPSAAAFGTWINATAPQTRTDVTVDRGGQTSTLSLTLEASPQVLLPPDPLTGLAWWARAAAGIESGELPQPIWALHLQQALMLIEARQLDAAIDMLLNTGAPTETPFGKAAVDYWLGVAITMGDDPDLGAARNALNRAASVSGGRLFHNDGPRIGPRARARIREIAAALER